MAKSQENGLFDIDLSDLTTSVSDALKEFGFYAERAAKLAEDARNSKIELERIAGSFFSIAKDASLYDGRPPSDKTVEAELDTDPDVIAAKKAYSAAKGKADLAQVKVDGLKYKMDIIRSLMVDERIDKQLHLTS